jgi:hypothetical protein
MPDGLKKIYEKASDIFFSMTKKFDGISDKIYEQTGKKINIGAIVLGIFLLLFVILMVKTILGAVLKFLLG